MKKNKYFLCIFALFIITFYISTYYFQFALIQGDSMKPAYRSWQLVILNKNPKELKTGDVISFRCETLNCVLIKRIVACPGDHMEIEDGILYVNNSPSPYVLSPINDPGIAQSPITLGTDEYFVLGDNYEYSKDSRHSEVGYVHSEDILGSVIPQIPISE